MKLFSEDVDSMLFAILLNENKEFASSFVSRW
jgi:hypothetical protein